MRETIEEQGGRGDFEFEQPAMRFGESTELGWEWMKRRGAGKATFARELLPNEADCPVCVNADLIATGLEPFQPERAALRAGRLMLEKIDRHVMAQESFALETTLAGLTYAPKIDAGRLAGYTVKLFFLSLASAEEAVARVATRVQQGGHSIPEKTIRRRLDAGLRNFQNVYRHRVSFWQWFDNSDRPPILLSEGTNP